MSYELLDFKIPLQTVDYDTCSRFVIASIEAIISEAIHARKNKIIINTNLKLGLLMENINKIAGPFVEAWAVETFHAVLEDASNRYSLIHVEAVERLHMADVILQFKMERNIESGVSADVDVKATAEDISSEWKITKYHFLCSDSYGICRRSRLHLCDLVPQASGILIS